MSSVIVNIKTSMGAYKPIMPANDMERPAFTNSSFSKTSQFLPSVVYYGDFKRDSTCFSISATPRLSRAHRDLTTNCLHRVLTLRFIYVASGCRRLPPSKPDLLRLDIAGFDKRVLPILSAFIDEKFWIGINCQISWETQTWISKSPKTTSPRSNETHRTTNS